MKDKSHVLIQYTNGWGHLIMSLVTMFIGCFLYVKGSTGLGLELIGMVAAAWFVPSAAKQMATEIVDQLQAKNAKVVVLPPTASGQQESQVV